MPRITMKRGDTFLQSCKFTQAGAAFDLTGTSIRSYIRDENDQLVAQLDVTLATQSGATLGCFTVSKAYALTESLPLGKAKFDIEYTFPDGTRISSEDIYVRICEGPTR